MIQEKCEKLNKDIHKRIFFNNFLNTIKGNHERSFTSLDLIEDCQDAIDEFESIPEENFPRRTTIYIYGVLQALYCQQDGLLHLYNSISERKEKTVHSLFEKYNFSNKIREVRNEIAGHPTDRKRGKEFYFIAKGQNSKYKFEYAGYAPDFRHIKVDLKEFIDSQKAFSERVLLEVESMILNKVKSHKTLYKDINLVSKLNIEKSIQSFNNIISEDESFEIFNLMRVKENIINIKVDLEKRYNNQITDIVAECLQTIISLVSELEDMKRKNKMVVENYAKYFRENFKNIIEELEAYLSEIDEEYND